MFLIGMKYILIVNLLVNLLMSGCGVKGAPIPKKDKVFIKRLEVKKSVLKVDEEQKPVKKKEKK